MNINVASAPLAGGARRRLAGARLQLLGGAPLLLLLGGRGGPAEVARRAREREAAAQAAEPVHYLVALRDEPLLRRRDDGDGGQLLPPSGWEGAQLAAEGAEAAADEAGLRGEGVGVGRGPLAVAHAQLADLAGGSRLDRHEEGQDRLGAATEASAVRAVATTEQIMRRSVEQIPWESGLLLLLTALQRRWKELI
jgi:hypothetical protein